MIFTRVMAACVLSFLAGLLVFVFGWEHVVNLWLSIFDDYRVCTMDAGEYVLTAKCGPWTAPFRVLGVAALLTTVALVLWFMVAVSRSLSRPVLAMTRTVAQLGPQNLGQRLRLRGHRTELRKLADALDDMLDRMATGYEGQRRFASNASHELRTPLAVQRTLVEVAMVTGEQDMPRLAAQLLAVNERNERLIEGLLVLAESDRGLPGTSPVRLDEVVAEVLDRFAEQAEKHEVTIERGLVDRQVMGDPVLLERLVSNLVHNAVKYNEPGGTVEVVVASVPALSITNTGQPVPAEVVPALFEPFRRLSDERTHHRDGAGLGLSIVRSIVSAHHGTVTATPNNHGGLRVTVELPRD